MSLLHELSQGLRGFHVAAWGKRGASCSIFLISFPSMRHITQTQRTVVVCLALTSISNQIIHVIGVPTIVWSALVWMTYAKPLWVMPTVPPEWTSTLSLTLGSALVTGYGLYYTSLDPIAGVRHCRSYLLAHTGAGRCMGAPVWPQQCRQPLRHPVWSRRLEGRYCCAPCWLGVAVHRTWCL